MLSERQRMILNAIIDDYIRSAEPVGSRTISKRGEVTFSPATIRNEMSDLEEMGYLEQPHTSAGRIPSQKGYRYYVDHLMKLVGTSSNEVQSMKRLLTDRLQETERLIQQAAMVLANLTNYTSIVLGPEVFNNTLKHIQLIPLNEDTAVAIIVTNTGHVENRKIQFPAGIPMSEIEKMVRIFNAKLAGVPLYRLKAKLYTEVSIELEKQLDHYGELLGVLESMLSQGQDDKLYFRGATNILTQPEFKDVEKVKTIFDIFEETQLWVDMFSSAPNGVQVRIGNENQLEAMNNCSLITATYKLEGQSVGTIGILGPTRMDYAKVIPLLDYLAKDLTRLLDGKN